MSIENIPLRTLEAEPTNLGRYGQLLLVVNVASLCGLTPQYEGLQRLHERYEGRGFSVTGFPCNQFEREEPGTPAEIRAFCSQRYNVTFPLFEKIDVNGPGRHPLYSELTAAKDANGDAGEIEWNFEKFLVHDGQVVGRFRPRVEPEDPQILGAIESRLASGS